MPSRHRCTRRASLSLARCLYIHVALMGRHPCRSHLPGGHTPLRAPPEGRWHSLRKDTLATGNGRCVGGARWMPQLHSLSFVLGKHFFAVVTTTRRGVDSLAARVRCRRSPNFARMFLRQLAELSLLSSFFTNAPIPCIIDVRREKKRIQKRRFLQQRNIERARIHHKMRGSFLSSRQITRAEKCIGSFSCAAYSAAVQTPL